MLISILLRLTARRPQAERAYVWQPAVTMTDSRIVSELTPSLY